MDLEKIEGLVKIIEIITSLAKQQGLNLKHQ